MLMQKLRFWAKSAFLLGLLVCWYPYAGVARSDDPSSAPATADAYGRSVRDFLAERVYERTEIDNWLLPKASSFSKYDALLGYRMANRILREGIDGSLVRYRYTDDGARKMVVYAERTCQINSYGSSFTDGEQVGDAETWQEFLAGHLEEPVRNYGIGGQTAYQSYVRMRREEQRTPAKYILFNLTPPFERQLVGWQALFYTKSAKHLAPPIPSVKVNSADDSFEERPNPCPTPESLYKFCDLDWICATYKDDLILHVQVAGYNSQQGQAALSYAQLMKLSADHGRPVNITTPTELRQACEQLLLQESLYATIRTIEQVVTFAKAHNKQVLFLLTYPQSDIERTVRSGQRFDQPIVDHLQQHKLPFVDLLAAFETACDGQLPIEDFLQPYYVGHHSPLGNAFIAYAVKDRLVDLMNPKPLPYRKE